MASRAREPRKRTTGVTRMDAALDAMRQFGFGIRLTRETVQELLDVYGGTQGWPFIEETSYKLLIETLLSKQEVSAGKDKDCARGDGFNNVTPSAGISDVGSSGLVSEDTVLHTSGGLELYTQASDQGNALHGNLETDVGDVALQPAGEGPEQGMNKSENEQKPADNGKGINDSTIVNKVKSTSDKAPIIQFSKAFNPLPSHRREGCYGWIGNGSDEDKEYVQFPIPQLSEQIEKMIGQYEAPQSGSSKRRKSRWDEQPEGKMVRSRGRDGKIIRPGQLSRGVHTLDPGVPTPIGSDDGSLHSATHSSSPSTSMPSSSTRSSTPSSSTPSSSRQEFRLMYPSQQTYVPSTSPDSSAFPAQPLPYAGTVHQGWAPHPAHDAPGPSSYMQPTSPPLMFATSSYIEPTPTPTVQPTHATIVQPTPAPTVQPTHATTVHPTPGSTEKLPTEEVHRDASGRVIIRPLGKGWAPNQYAIEAVGECIRSSFRGPFHHYNAMAEEDQLKWWTDFKTKVTWAPQDEWQIKKVFDSKVRKRLCDMLTKARTRGSRPRWIGEEAWDGLWRYWNTKKFKEKASQNKINRSSARGALHSFGRKSHSDVALDLERKYGRPIEPDELFMATHTNKKGVWVDTRARNTYESYQAHLRAIQSKSSLGSNVEVTQLDATTKLQAWKEVVGGKSRGRVYGTGDLAGNYRRGVSSLTQPSFIASSTPDQTAREERLMQELNESREYVRMTRERITQFEEAMRIMQQQMTMMMERQCGDASTGTSQFRSQYAEHYDQDPIP